MSHASELKQHLDEMIRLVVLDDSGMMPARAFLDQTAAEFRDAGLSDVVLGAMLYDCLSTRFPQHTLAVKLMLIRLTEGSTPPR